jgi:hypothetical protein
VAQRAVVFAVFAALAAAGFLPLVRGGPAAGVPAAELATLEKTLREGARLHPAAKPSPPAATAAFCAGCHPLPAHAGRRVADAMANEHAARMDCLVCHWSQAGGARPAPAWQVQSGASLLAALPAERTTAGQLQALRSSVTAARRCFERGPGCGGCHRPGGMAALLRPGTSPSRAAALERLENHFPLAPGEKWYFPQLQ